MGKKSSPPPPDYAAAAEATAAGDLEAAKYQTLANRPDSYYPGASRIWTQGQEDIFNQTGYDQAMADYNAALASYNAQQPTSGTSTYRPPAWAGTEDGTTPTQQPLGPAPVMPTRESFTSTGPDKWTETVSLSPEGQRAFDINERNTTALAELGGMGLEQARSIFDTPFGIRGEVPGYQGATGDMPEFRGPEGDVPDYGGFRQNVVDAMMGRVNTDVAREKALKRDRLIAQGIPPGSEAYMREMEQSDRKWNDARQQAEIAAEQMAGMGYASTLAGRQQAGTEGMDRFGTGMDIRNLLNQEGLTDYTTGMDTRRQGIQESLLQRQTPLNEISAFRTGSQVGIPQFQSFGQQPFTGGPDYTGAAQATGAYNLGRSNQDIAASNNLMGGLFSLGAAGIGAYPWSDRRLKKNIKRIGTSLMGLPVYAFDYIWGGDRQVGVMAQDVIKVVPEAVITRNGYMAVNYGMLR